MSNSIDYSVFTHQELQGFCKSKDRQLEGELMGSRKVQKENDELKKKIDDVLKYLQFQTQINKLSAKHFDAVVDIIFKKDVF